MHEWRKLQRESDYYFPPIFSSKSEREMPQVIQLPSRMEVLWLIKVILLLLITNSSADTMGGKLIAEAVKAFEKINPNENPTLQNSKLIS